ncbi:hypothetical protein DYS74_03800 [Sinirhodobacter hankyongi]|uniref:Uncharacterized protein n=1 Tax=Paenirhodobacter hankyongi TaxID=2294033 RepID=A0A421BTX8_9RHOB|nr:hypothetical protein DYS74_03800 [Sinirhodobacter hankyongi]
MGQKIKRCGREARSALLNPTRENVQGSVRFRRLAPCFREIRNLMRLFYAAVQRATLIQIKISGAQAATF